MRWYERLRRSGEIAFVRRTGRRAGLPTLSAYAVAGGRGRPLVGITVSKAVGSAVVRNLVRRRVRGALDAATPPANRTRLLFVMKPAAATEPYGRLASEVVEALRRLGGETS